MRWCHSEPTIAELLSDPIVRALMAADRIAPEELQANLTRIAGTLEPQDRDVRRDGRSQCAQVRSSRTRLSARRSETFPDRGECAE
jgi:hypothetical protein